MDDVKSLSITSQQARHFILSHQGLFPPQATTGKSSAFDHIRRLGSIQFDPLNIVGRNPDLVLQSRVADYTAGMLETLLYEDRTLVDGWDKMMSIYPTEDWPFFTRRRDAMHRYFGHEDRPAVAILPQVREAIRQQGPLSSIDLEHNQKVNWAWGPTRLARAALESMTEWGELIIHHKVNTRKVYDFASNHIPHDLLSAADPFDTVEDYHDWHILRRIGSLGLIWHRASPLWHEIRGLRVDERNAAMKRLMVQKKIIEITIKDFPHTLYMRSSDLVNLHAILSQVSTPTEAAVNAVIIAPLDNLLWDRSFIETLFGFHYRWEVYKPVVQREFGYYVLPILYGDRFVARFEPGWDKRHRTVIIKQWWWEPDVAVTESLKNALRQCFERFVRYRDAQALSIMPEAYAMADLAWLG